MCLYTLEAADLPFVKAYFLRSRYFSDSCVTWRLCLMFEIKHYICAISACPADSMTVAYPSATDRLITWQTAIRVLLWRRMRIVSHECGVDPLPDDPHTSWQEVAFHSSLLQHKTALHCCFFLCGGQGCGHMSGWSRAVVFSTKGILTSEVYPGWIYSRIVDVRNGLQLTAPSSHMYNSTGCHWHEAKL